MVLPPGRLIRARDHLGPVAIHPIIPTPTNTGTNDQYLRTSERLCFFFFLLIGGAAMISLSGGDANNGDQILVCYNPNSSPCESGPSAAAQKSSP
jgi:hypothetical protein